MPLGGLVQGGAAIAPGPAEASPPFPAPAGLRFNHPNKVDALQFLRSLPDHSVAAAFFDPQYAPSSDKVMPRRGMKRAPMPLIEKMPTIELREIIYEVGRVLIQSGYLFLWTDKRHLLTGKVQQWTWGTHLCEVDLITWAKPSMGLGSKTRHCTEFVLVTQKEPFSIPGRSWTVKDLRDFWQEPKPLQAHPHNKPVGLQARLIEAVTQPGEVIIDPCGGSFSVLDSVRQAGGGRWFLGGDLFGGRFVGGMDAEHNKELHRANGDLFQDQPGQALE